MTFDMSRHFYHRSCTLFTPRQLMTTNSKACYYLLTKNIFLLLLLPFIYLFIYLFIYSFIYLSICLFIYFFEAVDQNCYSTYTYDGVEELKLL